MWCLNFHILVDGCANTDRVEQEFYTSSESNIADAAGQDALVVRAEFYSACRSLIHV